jgi:hypothetical protein
MKNKLTGSAPSNFNTPGNQNEDSTEKNPLMANENTKNESVENRENTMDNTSIAFQPELKKTGKRGRPRKNPIVK